MSAPSSPLLCIAGKSLLAVAILLHAREHCSNADIVACPNRDDAGQDGAFRSLAKAAREAGVPTVPLEAVFDAPDVVFLSLEFDRIVPPARFASPRLFNLHYSLLPAYKGCYPAVLPILHGAGESGVTLHQIDAGIDTGPIIAQARFPLGDMRSADLYLRCRNEGIALVKAWLPALLAGKYEAHPQAAEGASYYPRDCIDFRDWPIQFRATASQVVRQFHARYFPHFQRPEFAGHPIARCTITPERSREKPGSVQFQDERVICIATIDYDVALHIEPTVGKGATHGGTIEPL